MDKYIIYFKNTGIRLFLVADFQNNSFVFSTKQEFATTFPTLQDAYNYMMKYIPEADGLVITNKLLSQKPPLIPDEWKNYKSEFTLIKDLRVLANGKIIPKFFIQENTPITTFIDELLIFAMKSKLRNNETASGIICSSNKNYEGELSFLYRYRNEIIQLYKENGQMTKVENPYNLFRIIQENYFYESILNQSVKK